MNYRKSYLKSKLCKITKFHVILWILTVSTVSRAARRNSAETVGFHKTSTPGNQVKLRYFMHWQQHGFLDQQELRWVDYPQKMLGQASCVSCEIFKNTFSTEHPRKTASDNRKIHVPVHPNIHCKTSSCNFTIRELNW